ncbi:MAG: hypothetical protein KDD08_12820, partial [Mangrovimonas sp.]|nr:hypothetical protein [Mangrovimonas sp.]
MKLFFKIMVVLIGFQSFSQVDGVGINTTNPQSTLDINGNVSFKVVTLNGGPGGSATQITNGFYINLVPSSGNLEFILPDAASFPGRTYILRNITDAFTAQIYSFGGQFFPGDSRVATSAPINMTPDTAGDGGDVTKTLIFISDGTNWTYGT